MLTRLNPQNPCRVVPHIPIVFRLQKTPAKWKGEKLFDAWTPIMKVFVIQLNEKLRVVRELVADEMHHLMSLQLRSGEAY
jgi:hypothetical protein